MYTFSWSRPNVRTKLLKRAVAGDVERARRSLLTSYLLAQDRGELIADCNLARLKQATTCFVLAGIAALFVTGLFVLDVAGT